jgi:hypothetical protein
MKTPSLDTLLMTEVELKLARKQIERMAYEKWEGAGCPDADPLEFWREAEREWIQYQYVPDRDLCVAENI